MRQNPPIGPQKFLDALGVADQTQLLNLAALARQERPAHLLHWFCGNHPLGLLPPQRAAWLSQNLPDCTLIDQVLVWHAQNLAEAQRSEQLQATLELARDQVLLSGWRNERFNFWHANCTMPDSHHSAFLRIERSGFRWLGMVSHAVHVNGFLLDGRLWCARRALTKATDPGMLDNFTAGGLPSGESVHDCLVRELEEEAGLYFLPEYGLQAAGNLRTSRLETEGWHDEIIHVFNLTLPADFVPNNQDGEVSEFMCLDAKEVLAKAQAGSFTLDAVASLVQGLRYCA